MPERVPRQAGEASRRPATALAAALLLLGLGCFFDLDVPSVPATPVVPFLTVATPQPGDTISLTQQVSVAADSVYGISSVSVLCGPLDGGARTVFTWTSPPYLANVNFAACQDVTQPNPDGGNPLLNIGVYALSDAGTVQDAGLTVFLDDLGPDLVVQYPPTAQPKSPFTVTVSSNIALSAIPQVALASTPADTVTAGANPDGGLPLYTAVFLSTPGLGTDNIPYTPGVPVPIEALTDTDETVRLSVSATALNGNTTEVDLSVELTRVVWDRYIPGQPASTQNNPENWAAQPLAFAGGLLLPLATSSPASATSVWLPGLLTAADGTFIGFDTSVLPDAGYLASGINSQGQTLFANFNGSSSSYLLAPPPGTVGTPVTSTNEPRATPPLTRVDSLLCLQDAVTGCSEEALESLECFNPNLHPVTASGAGGTGPPVPGVVAGGGGRYLSPVSPICNASWNLVDLGTGTVTFGPLADPNGIAGCNITAVSKLFAVGDGTFVVQLTESCGVTAPLPPEYPIVRVGANGTILGAYTAPLGTPALVQQNVVGVLVDGRVVTLSNVPPYTNFSLWRLNSSTPDVVTPIAGLYNSADAVLNSVVARSSYAGNDGSFAVLLSNNEVFGAAIAAFGPNLQPRWLYLYARVSEANTVRLVSASDVPDVYLLDERNNHAVAVRVQPPGADAGVSRTVSGSEETLFQLPAPDTILTPDLSQATISAAVAPQGVYGPPLFGTGYSDGTFTLAGIPTSGDYLLDVAGSYYWFSDASLNIMNLAAGRPDVVSFDYSVANDATLTLNLTNAAPWNVGNDEIEVLSLGANDYLNTSPFGCNPSPTPAAGATTLSGSVFSVKQCGGPNTIQSAKGDTVLIEQLAAQQTSNGSFYLSLARYFQPAAFSLSDGQNVTVNGAFLSVDQDQTVNCDFRLSQFSAALQGAVPMGFTSFLQWGASVVGTSFITSAGLTPPQGLADVLDYSPTPPTTDAVSGPMTYGVPATYPFAVSGIVQYNAFAQFAFPGTTAANQEQIGMQNLVSLDAFCAGPLVPGLTPPRGLTLNGLDASKPLTGVGLTPLVAWSAPATGTASRYHVLIFQFVQAGAYTVSSLVAEIRTRELQVPIPPGLLSAGNTYNIEILADGTVPIGAGYLLLGESSSSAASGIFTP